jgi:hypothetical protein
MFKHPCLGLRCYFLWIWLFYLIPISQVVSGALPQNRPAPSIDPQLRLLQSYRRYPERYLRISRESWKYEKKSQTAFHSFTLINTAAARYRDIQVRISYQTSAGKVVNEQTIKIPGVIGPSTTLQVDQLRVKGVPAAAETAALSVVSAVPQQ